ncbi:MAG: glycosyltransferase family 92 protein [Treponema sp.]|nr:glycosyltransferase family 92 protein [Treponema sp.]
MKEFIKKILHLLLDPFFNIWFKINWKLFNKKNSNNDYKYYVSICAIFKDEGNYLKEWIEYYKLIGTDHIFLYNNFSTDNYKEILQKYIDNNFITFIDWPVQQGQLKAYRHCIENYSTISKWIGFFDIDEFFVSLNHKTLTEELQCYELYPSVVANWKTFGSSSITNRDLSIPVIKDFTKCQTDYYWGKYFINNSYTINYNYRRNKQFVHSIWIKVGFAYIPPITCNYKFYFGKYIDILNRPSNQKFWLNHYYTKSKSEFEIRINKTDVLYKKNNKNIQILDKLDKKCVETDTTIQYYLPELIKQL